MIFAPAGNQKRAVKGPSLDISPSRRVIVVPLGSDAGPCFHVSVEASTMVWSAIGVAVVFICVASAE